MLPRIPGRHCLKLRAEPWPQRKCPEIRVTPAYDFGSVSGEAKKRFGKTIPSGAVLFQEGELGDTMYVLQSGRVAISKTVKGGEQVLAVLEAGEFFGEMAILNGKPRSATAEVVEDAEVLEINAKKFEGMLAGNSEIAIRLIKKLSRRLDAVNDLLAVMTHRDPLERVILSLIRHAQTAGAGEPGEPITLPLDEAALAEELGLTEEESQSALTRLGRLGLVNDQGHGIEVVDVPRLHDFFEFVEQRVGEEP